MKRYSICLVFFVCSFILARNFRAQTRLDLLSLDISFPVNESIALYTGGQLDTSYTMNFTVSESEHRQFYPLSSNLFSSLIGDSTFLKLSKYYNSNYHIYPEYLITISFFLDSINHKFYDFVYNYSQESTPSYPQSDRTIHISFSSMNYYTSGDTLFAKQSGSECIKELDSGSYTYNRTNAPYPHFTGENDRTKRIRYEDTSEFKYSVVLLLQRNSSVGIQYLSQAFFISASLPDHTIHFTFPSSYHSQTISIYDILGREVKRIEIPSGVSEYRLKRDGFMSGYYFARLGSQSASFIVN